MSMNLYRYAKMLLSEEEPARRSERRLLRVRFARVEWRGRRPSHQQAPAAPPAFDHRRTVPIAADKTTIARQPAAEIIDTVTDLSIDYPEVHNA